MVISHRICYNNVTMKYLESEETSVRGKEKMKTTMIELRYDGIVDVLRDIETSIKKPKNTEDVLQIWEAHISKNMRYDALNFAISKMFPP